MNGDDREISEREEELTLWEEETPATAAADEQLAVWTDETPVSGTEGDEGLTLWSDQEELPPLSELLLKEGESLTLSPPADYSWERARKEWEKFALSPGDYYGCLRALQKSLYGARLYASGDPAERRRGAELIHAAAKKRDAVGMRERAVVLLEGLVCERDPASALRWLHMAVRAGDIKALRILVYALYGVPRLVVVPRVQAEATDGTGRTMPLDHLFDGVTLTAREKAHYIHRLIEFTQFCEEREKGIPRPSLERDRRYAALLFGYILRANEADPALLKEVPISWLRIVRAHLVEDCLYDGVLIVGEADREEQIRRLLSITGLDEEELEEPMSPAFEQELKKDFPPAEGRYYDQKTPEELRRMPEEICRIKKVACTRYGERNEEIRQWSASWLWEIARKNPRYCSYHPSLYVLCVETLFDRILQMKSATWDGRRLDQARLLLYRLYQLKKLQGLDAEHVGLDGFSDSAACTRLFEKAERLADMAPDRTDFLCRLGGVGEGNRGDIRDSYYQRAVKLLAEKYSRSYDKEELAALKKEAEEGPLPREASYLLGLRYECGQGTQADWREAAGWYQKGFDGFYDEKSRARFQTTEAGAEKLTELREALTLLHGTQAALGAGRIEALSAEGFAPAMFAIARQKLDEGMGSGENYYGYDPQEGVRLMSDAADKGNLSAMHEMEMIFQRGRHGMAPNAREAENYRKLQLEAMGLWETNA